MKANARRDECWRAFVYEPPFSGFLIEATMLLPALSQADQ
jgi:hypothetical protein